MSKSKETKFLNEIPAHVDYIHMTPNDDAPWCIVADVRKPDLLKRIENAICQDLDAEKVKITHAHFSSISMLGELSFVVTQDGERDSYTISIGTTSIY